MLVGMGFSPSPICNTEYKYLNNMKLLIPKGTILKEVHANIDKKDKNDIKVLEQGCKKRSLRLPKVRR
jgi:hypothetical protein